ncbi:MAG TPA: DUF5993 family protein [Wenzhouxiangella sp.]|uniref:Uncharacterized protein n=1 Tax=Kaustia mangrovi TaxID=2593653 RepID=A0A7S8C6H1_9HYPH|nr:DUF5993 family protein [Kaustia mangrovi]QPC44227.1 hypothetical protein HW532_16900 [Kaustia mangrovi]HSH26353.1 DUF5993 family protein [Wenzhouxiangella sp.]
MYIAGVFLILTVTLIAAALASRRLAIALFAVSLAVMIAVYLHHATDTLPLSF